MEEVKKSYLFFNDDGKILLIKGDMGYLKFPSDNFGLMYDTELLEKYIKKYEDNMVLIDTICEKKIQYSNSVNYRKREIDVIFKYYAILLSEEDIEKLIEELESVGINAIMMDSHDLAYSDRSITFKKRTYSLAYKLNQKLLYKEY